MKRPPVVLETIVEWLVPPACREHVVGDLSERYRSDVQYIIDALHTVPFVVASRIRRTLIASLLLAQACALFLSFEAAWRLAGMPFLSRLAQLVPFLIASLISVCLLVLCDAYADGVRSKFRLTLEAAVCLGLSYFVQLGLSILRPGLALPNLVMLYATVIGILLVSALRVYLATDRGSRMRPVVASAAIVRQTIQKYEQKIRRMRRSAYSGFGVVAAIFIPYIWISSEATHRIAGLCAIGLSLCALWRFHRLWTAGHLAEQLSDGTDPEGCRRELERLQTTLRGVWPWFEPIFAPATLFLIWSGVPTSGIEDGAARTAAYLLLYALGCEGYQRMVRELQRDVDELKSAFGGKS